MRYVVLVSAFVILWFLALQILLPIGNGSAHENGIPANPRIALKVALATIAAAALWTIFYVLVLMRLINL
ncbi:MAG TPA: DUF1467 family protein [Rhizomicrobium sp.]|jgi:predicted secreted protein